MFIKTENGINISELMDKATRNHTKVQSVDNHLRLDYGIHAGELKIRTVLDEVGWSVSMAVQKILENRSK